MKNLLISVMVCAAMAMAGERIASDVVTFVAKGGVAYLDSLLTTDSLVCVIDQIEGSVLANKMSLFLPALTGQSDTITVIAQQLPSPDANKRAETRNSENQSYVADNVAAPKSTGATYTYKKHILGGYSYGLGAMTFNWSPQDSLICPRVRILLGNAYRGTTVVTGCDSLVTSTARINKLFSIE